MAFKIPKPRIARPRLETFDRGHAQSSVYRMLPSPVTALYGAIAAGSITGIVWLAGDLSGHNGFQWSMIAMGVMTVIAFAGQGWSFLRGKRAQKSQQEFGEAVTESAGGAVEDVSDPAEVARVDDLRKRFQDGVKVFHEYGKDIYALPWYVIVGEPGSGKSEAIRNSQLRFPEMLTDRLQGTGGTYSMHWWFTNNAVLLDTAGAMLMQPEATERFEEFLRLLRSHRPDCPINGLLLAIPVDSLFIDDPVRTEEKARTIATQLEVIQEALDIRFPIYLLITKSDRLPGFREFFDAPGQQTFEPEMVGWSNPYGLDQPFRPDQVYEALEEIASRLRARRFSLLSDPIPRQPGARRIDEVDALYAYPEVVVSLGERLERYLRVIFQTGAWETRPPFFRGLYFTSALREGSALDSELASALGVPVESLPVGGIWDRQKSVHLRDVFLEKIFREQGLVTRLLDIAAAFRRRLVWLLAITVGLMLSLALFFFIAHSNIKEDLKAEEPFWHAGNATWDNGRFLSIIDREETGQPPRPRFRYAGDVKDDGSKERLSFIKEAHDKASKDIDWGWLFHPIKEFRRFEDNRLAASRTLFEGGVMKPVVDAAREKLWWDANIGFDWWPGPDGTADSPLTKADRTKRAAEATIALLRLNQAVDRNEKAAEGTEALNWKDDFFRPLLNYVLPETPAVASNTLDDLHALTNKVYERKEFPLHTRTWLLGDDGKNDRNDAADGSDPVAAIIRQLLGYQDIIAESAKSKQQGEDRIREAIKAFHGHEDLLARTLENGDALFENVRALLEALKLQKDAIEKVRADVGLPEKPPITNEMWNKLATVVRSSEKYGQLAPDGRGTAVRTEAEPRNDPDLQDAVSSAYAGRLESYLELIFAKKEQSSPAPLENLLKAVPRTPVRAGVAPSTTKTSDPSAVPVFRSEVQARIRQHLEEFTYYAKCERILDAKRNIYATFLANVREFPLVQDGVASDPEALRPSFQLIRATQADLEALRNEGDLTEHLKIAARMNAVNTALAPLFDLVRAISSSSGRNDLPSWVEVTLEPSLVQAEKGELPPIQQIDPRTGRPFFPEIDPTTRRPVQSPPRQGVVKGGFDGEARCYFPETQQEMPGRTCLAHSGVVIKANYRAYDSLSPDPIVISRPLLGEKFGILKTLSQSLTRVIPLSHSIMPDWRGAARVSFPDKRLLPAQWPTKASLRAVSRQLTDTP